jgi:hypothetical protein
MKYTTFRPSKVDKATRCLLQAVLTSHGFKWSYRQGTDLCRGIIDVELNASDEIVVKYKKQSNGFFTRNESVFSKSVGSISKIEVPEDLNNYLVVVVVKQPVDHYDWKGKVVQD